LAIENRPPNGSNGSTAEVAATRPLKPFDRNITMLESGPPDYDWAWDKTDVRELRRERQVPVQHLPFLKH
jgi:hypothetical protein